MGRPSAPDDLDKGVETQVWLAVSADSDALLSGRYLYHGLPQAAHPASLDVVVQSGFLKSCEALTGVSLAKETKTESDIGHSNQ
jgi:hypothetical protein